MPDRAPMHHMPIFGKQHIPKGKRDTFYSSRPWRELRRMVLADSPLCADPFGIHRKQGRYELAGEVDHVIPRDQRPELSFDQANLQPLCKGCHSRKTRKEHKAW